MSLFCILNSQEGSQALTKEIRNKEKMVLVLTLYLVVALNHCMMMNHTIGCYGTIELAVADIYNTGNPRTIHTHLCEMLFII